VAKQGGGCLLDAVAYKFITRSSKVKKGKACHLFHEMMRQGVVPDAVTCTSVIDALCEAGAMDKAELFLGQMIDNGV
jgi:pentatricopeptide repeat protein